MEYLKQKIEAHYEMYDNPELVGKSTAEIHEYQLGFSEEAGSRKNGLERLVNLINLSNLSLA